MWTGKKGRKEKGKVRKKGRWIRYKREEREARKQAVWKDEKGKKDA